MTTLDALRSRYKADAIATASPARLVVMLYDRLLLDLGQAAACLHDGDRLGARPLLQHAQDIVLELRTSLDTEAWSGGPALASLYTFLFTQLVTATVDNDVDKVVSCRQLVEPLAEAWEQAASSVVPAHQRTTA